MHLLDSIKAFALHSLPDSEVELTGDIPFEALSNYRTQAIARLKENAELPGFRKGHVPEDILIKKVGEISILEEAVEYCLADLYPKLVTAKKLNVVGRPVVRITKLAPGNSVGISIKTAVFPMVMLPDYRKVARGIKKEEPGPVTEEEVKIATEAIRKNAGKKKEGPEEFEIPELTDAFVKSVGDFKDVADFNQKIRVHLVNERERIAREKRRGQMSDALIEPVQERVPAIFVESELQKILGQLREDVDRMGMSFEEYLKRMKKSEEEIRNDFKESARKRAVLQLTLNAIAEKEAVKIDPEDVKKEEEHILKHFSAKGGSSSGGKDIDRERVHIYVESVMRNEKTLQLLENL